MLQTSYDNFIAINNTELGGKGDKLIVPWQILQGVPRLSSGYVGFSMIESG